MTLLITIASNEVEDFAMEIAIDGNATFLDLHRTILKACHYEEGERHRFYICDEDWRPEHRIMLTDEGTASDEDLLLMEETYLCDYLEDEGQRLAYRFDPESKRILLLELTETSFGNRQEKPALKRHVGIPPVQTLEEEEEDIPTTAKKPSPADEDEDIGEDFYGDDGFDTDEIDMEGFEVEIN